MHIKLLTLKDTQETNLKHLKILLPADSTTTSRGSTKYNGKGKLKMVSSILEYGDHCGCYHMVVGYTFVTTYAISTYHH